MHTTMRIVPLRTTLPIVALICGAGLALAQQPPPAGQPAPAAEQQQTGQQTPIGKAGIEEGSAQVPSAPQGPFVNGALAVPGAPANTDTVPAKYSAKNDADDHQIIAAYTFKTLTPEQRRAIVQALKQGPGAPAAPRLKAELGQVIPPAVQLRPVPDEVAAKVPQTKGYQYAATDTGVVLVSPATRYVAGALADE
jgi:Protein of unknown function (DUF1236)